MRKSKRDNKDRLIEYIIDYYTDDLKRFIRNHTFNDNDWETLLDLTYRNKWKGKIQNNFIDYLICLLGIDSDEMKEFEGWNNQNNKNIKFNKLLWIILEEKMDNENR